MTLRRKASIYSIASNHSRAIEDELNSLSESNQQGDIRGMINVVSNRQNKIEVGRVGSYGNDNEKDIGALFRAAVALVMAG